MADPRIPQGFSEVPDDAFLSPEEFFELHQELAERRLTDEDGARPFRVIAGLLFASIAGGYVALRHFPKSRVAGMAGEVRDFFANPRRFGIKPRVLAKLERVVGQADELAIQQPWLDLGRADKLGQVLGSARAANDPDMLQALQTLLEIARKNPKNFGSVNSVMSVVKNQYRAQLPQAVGKSGMRRLTLGDLFDPTGGWKRKVWGIDRPRQLAKVQNVLEELHAQIPGLKNHINYFNISVDPGLYMRQRGAGVVTELIDLPGMRGASNFIQGLQKRAAQPGVAGAINSMFLRTMEYLPTAPMVARAGAPEFAMLPAQVAREYFPSATAGRSVLRGVSHVVFMGGQVRPVYAGGGLGPAFADDVILANRRSAVGAMAQSRKSEMYLRQRVARGGQSVGEQYIKSEGIDPDGPWAALIRLGDKVGVGPQFMTAGSPELIPTGLPQKIGDIFVDPAKTFRKTMQEIFRRPGHHATPAAGHGDLYPTTRQELRSDYTNYLLNRVGWLFRETLGGKVGLRLGVTPAETTRKWLGLAAAGSIGFGALQYADYTMRQVTGTGPITGPLQAYAALRNVGQHVLAGTGIQQSAAYLENLMPGLIESPLSKIVRGAATYRMLTGRAPLGFLGIEGIGANLASRINLPGRYGFLGKVLAGAAAFGQLTDVTQSPVELAAVFRGEKNVPIRQGRYWALGTQPITGGRITHTRPHFIASYLSHAREIGVYGSERGRWANSLLPTPESWFGLRPLMRPYEVEQRNYLTRPYPMTGPFGPVQDFPFISPLLEGTIGELIKPTQRWHKQYWAAGNIVDPTFGAGPAGAAAALGYPSLSPVQQTVGSPNHVLQRIGKQIDLLKDFLGMPGFLGGYLKNLATGSSEFIWHGREVATAGRMTSSERAFYDLELGGGLGMTELFRRFLPHRRRSIELVNPVPNASMPSWMPGSFSAFPNDRKAYLDFHRGDPYARISSGEARLPGPGYEAIHRLHSGIPGVYDVYDRWKILRDVAPTSQAFRHYDALVRSWARTSNRARTGTGEPLKNVLSPIRGIVTRAVDGDTVVVNVAGELMTVRIAGGDAPEIAHQRWERSLPDSVAGQVAKMRLDRELRGREVTVNPVGIQESPDWMAQQTGVHQRIIANVFTDRRNISEELAEAYPAYNLSSVQTAEVQNTRAFLERRFEAYPFTERIFNNPFATIPRNMRDLTTRSLSGINTAIKSRGQFSLPEKIIGRAWESVSHVRLPGPLQWPINKLFAQQSALERYRMETQGADFGDWNRFPMYPVEGWVNSTIGMLNPSYVPEQVKRQRAITEQIDAMQFMRMRHFQRLAMSRGNSELAMYYKNAASRTVTGTVLSGSLRNARGALPRTERGFYSALSRARSYEQRQEILDVVSPSMGAILKMGWRGDVDAEDRARVGAQMAIAKSHLNHDHAAWHPQYPISAMKVRVAHNQGWDIHDLGLTTAEEFQAVEYFSALDYAPVAPRPRSVVESSRAYIHRMSGRLQFTGTQVTAENVPGSPSVRFSLRRNQQPEMFEHFSSRQSMGMRF